MHKAQKAKVSKSVLCIFSHNTDTELWCFAETYTLSCFTVPPPAFCCISSHAQCGRSDTADNAYNADNHDEQLIKLHYEDFCSKEAHHRRISPIVTLTTAGPPSG